MNKKFRMFLPYGRHQVNETDINEVINVLRNKNLTQGGVTKDFEEAISKKVSSKYCVVVNSATSALHLACLAIGLNSNDILWTSPNSFVASANCGAYVGANVDFVDIEPSTGLMSMNKLIEKLKIAEIEKKLPKVIIPVHLAGTVCEMEKLHDLSKIYNFKIIEDASHAIGAKYNNENVGNCRYSDITVFSFHPVKIITSGEGGCITTNNKEIEQIIYKLRTHGITKNVDDFENPFQGGWAYEQQMLGFNYRMSDIHAALGLSQLKRLESIVRERNKQLSFYKKLLKGFPIKFLEIPSNVYSSVHLAVIRLENKSEKFHRSLYEQLINNDLGVQIHYIPIHLQPYYRKKGFSEGDFPAAEEYAKNAISLPLYVGLSEQDQIRVASTLKGLLCP